MVSLPEILAELPSNSDLFCRMSPTIGENDSTGCWPPPRSLGQPAAACQSRGRDAVRYEWAGGGRVVDRPRDPDGDPDRAAAGAHPAGLRAAGGGAGDPGKR